MSDEIKLRPDEVRSKSPPTSSQQKVPRASWAKWILYALGIAVIGVAIVSITTVLSQWKEGRQYADPVIYIKPKPESHGGFRLMFRATACRSLADYDQYRAMAASGDIKAAATYMEERQYQGDCVVFEEGVEIALDRGVAGNVCIREWGTQQCYWTRLSGREMNAFPHLRR